MVVVGPFACFLQTHPWVRADGAFHRKRARRGWLSTFDASTGAQPLGQGR